MAYVDGLVISGSAQMLKLYISVIQEEFTHPQSCQFPHVRQPIFLRRTIKRLKNGNITIEFSLKFIDELLKVFEVTGTVTTTGVELQALPERSKGSM